jgi:hypothetical protein
MAAERVALTIAEVKKPMTGLTIAVIKPSPISDISIPPTMPYDFVSYFLGLIRCASYKSSGRVDLVTDI